ncbi:MAG: hypothetical protein WCT12_03530 [Verrucomicrobiota bacterium]
MHFELVWFACRLESAARTACLSAGFASGFLAQVARRRMAIFDLPIGGEPPRRAPQQMAGQGGFKKS